MSRHNFYVVWATRAFREAVASTGFKDRGEITRGLVLWALAVLVLYAVNWRGWPIVGASDPGGGEQIRLGLCAVAAILVVFVGSFVWQLIVQPAKIYKETLDLIDDAERIICAVGDSEADRLFLSEAHKEGFRLYRAEFDPNDPSSVALWKTDMDAWVAKIRAHLKERWSISALHDFEVLSSMGGTQYRRKDTDSFLGGDETPLLKNQYGFSIFCTYSAYLKNIDDIIRHGEYRHLGDVQEILMRREALRIEARP